MREYPWVVNFLIAQWAPINLKQLLLKAYLVKVLGFSGDHMLMG